MVSQETDRVGRGFVTPSPCEPGIPFGPARGRETEKKWNNERAKNVPLPLCQITCFLIKIKS